MRRASLVAMSLGALVVATACTPNEAASRPATLSELLPRAIAQHDLVVRDYDWELPEDVAAVTGGVPGLGARVMLDPLGKDWEDLSIATASLSGSEPAPGPDGLDGLRVSAMRITGVDASAILQPFIDVADPASIEDYAVLGSPGHLLRDEGCWFLAWPDGEVAFSAAACGVDIAPEDLVAALPDRSGPRPTS